MARNVFGHTIYQGVILLVLLFAGPKMLLDFTYELQCMKYNAQGHCDHTAGFNPYFTDREYYNPEIWAKYTNVDGTFKSSSHKWDQYRLHQWQCNIYGQEFPSVGDALAARGLCTLRLTPEKWSTSNYVRAKSALNAEDRKLYDLFFNSAYSKITPATRRANSGDSVSSHGFRTEETKLFSFVFNTFVFMQVFNQLNARALEEGELNIFAGLMSNPAFIGIVVVTVIVQLLMVEFGGKMVKCWPLNFMQNLLCIGIGAGELPWGLLIKFLPIKMFDCLSLEDKNEDAGEGKVYLSQAIKGGKKKTAEASD